jgi:pimeloyl-ACP methyl ester carboxylesterase
MVPEAVRTADGRALHVERAGAGAPVVVFESGMGASRCSWGAVAPVVAERTAVAIYDRSGLGQSAPDGARRDLARLVSDHLAVLAHLGPGPFVLVGHSWGGPVVRAAAAQAPEVIAGLVLVDQTDEGCDLFFGAANERQVRWSRTVLPLLARTGLLRLGVRRLAASLPEPWATQMAVEDGTRAAVQAQLAELAHSVADLRRLRDQPPTLPDVPVTVISGTRTGFLERGRRPPLVAAHRARAAALPQGRHVTADASSHYVQLTDPEVVIREILSIVVAP